VDGAALPKLVKLLEDEDGSVRSVAAEALGRYAVRGAVDRAALPKLVKLLEDEDEDVRRRAALALVRYAEQGVVDEGSVYSLVGLLGDEDEDVRIAAGKALDAVAGRLGVSREGLIRDPSLAAGPEAVASESGGEGLPGPVGGVEVSGRVLRLLEAAPPGLRVTRGQIAEKLGLDEETVEEALLELVSARRVPGTYNAFGGVFEKAAAPEPASLGGFAAVPGYRVEKLIGEGGFASVYLGVRESDGRRVAVKLPRIAGFSTVDSSLAEDFLREAEVWSKLRHGNIVEVYDYDVTPVPHIVMEYMPEGSLRVRIGRLGLEEALRVFFEVAGAVSFAHHYGVVHRDLKPENILFTGGGVAKVTDWGLARVMIEASRSTGVGFKGTLAYAAPEQLDPKRFGGVDWRTDVYQLGCVLYEMVSGRPPFMVEGDYAVVHSIFNEPPPPLSGIPSRLEEIILRALSKRKEERFQSVERMIFELERLADSLGSGR